MTVSYNQSRRLNNAFKVRPLAGDRISLVDRLSEIISASTFTKNSVIRTFQAPVLTCYYSFKTKIYSENTNVP